MKNRIKMIVLVFSFLFITLLTINTKVFATTKNVQIVTKETNEYIIYIRGHLNAEFKYALSNDKDSKQTSLNYKIASLDSSNQDACFVAYIDFKSYEKLKDGDIYLWVKDENDNFSIQAEKLDLSSVIKQEDINLVETTTKRINVNNKFQTTEEKIENDVKITNTVDNVKILEDETYTYKYQLIKANISEDYKRFVEIAEMFEKNEYDKFQKIELIKEFYDLYIKLIKDIELSDVENMIIKQPIDSKNGEKYVLWISMNDGENVINDVQFLTAYEKYNPEVIKEEIIVESTSKLPVTYDSIALFVILAIVFALLIIVFIKIKKLSKEEKK